MPTLGVATSAKRKSRRFGPDPGRTCDHDPDQNDVFSGGWLSSSSRGVGCGPAGRGTGSTNRRKPHRVQWLTWPGVLPERLDVAAASDVAGPPDRLERHRGDERARQTRDSSAECCVRASARAPAPRSPARGRTVVRERQRRGVPEHARQALVPPLGAEVIVGQVEPGHRDAREALVHPSHHVPLADADLEDPLRRQPVGIPSSARMKPRIMRCSIGVASWRTCRTCCRSGSRPAIRVGICVVMPEAPVWLVSSPAR